MNGLQLSREYFETQALPSLRRELPELMEHLAAGLAGNGSECFGYDDELSRDHDWGIDFSLWVDPAAAEAIPALRSWKETLFRRFPPAYIRKASVNPGQQIIAVPDFYRQFLGVPGRPQSMQEWLRIPEENLAMAVNGMIFYDGPGLFSRIREELLTYYPEDLRRKKLSSCCMAAAQTGQYNYGRTVRRQDPVTASIVLNRFVEQVIAMTFLLERTYRPYYKWQFRRMRELPLGRRLSPLLQDLVAGGPPSEKEELILCITEVLCGELRRQGLTTTEDWFLEAHGKELLTRVRDPYLLSLPVYH